MSGERVIGSMSDAISFLWELLSEGAKYDRNAERRDDDDDAEEKTDPGVIDVDGEEVD